MAGPRKERTSKRGTRREGSKDPVIPVREYAKPETLGPNGYQSTMDLEDLSLIRIAYYIMRVSN